SRSNSQNAPAPWRTDPASEYRDDGVVVSLCNYLLFRDGSVAVGVLLGDLPAEDTRVGPDVVYCFDLGMQLCDVQGHTCYFRESSYLFFLRSVSFDQQYDMQVRLE
ncbi:hypothetical protein FRC08_017229, partial [Ceratobasidium sp. 394]